MNRWTVNVRNFGRIKEATVQVAPLTIFVGNNNSGKSYLMTIIYGLLTYNFLDNRPKADSNKFPSFRQCHKILSSLVEQITNSEEMIVTLKNDDLSPFQEFLNEILAENKESFVSNLFNKKIAIDHLSISWDCKTELSLSFTRAKGEDGIEEVTVNAISDNNSTLQGYVMPVSVLQGNAENAFFFISYVIKNMLRRGFWWREPGRKFDSKCLFLPTARTGFMLTYKNLVEKAVEEKFSIETTAKTLLSRPCNDFLKELSTINVENDTNCFSEILEFIENNLIDGHISVSDLPTCDISYRPNAAKDAIPLYVSSGVVTELAPLILFLRYSFVSTLFVEEPEISMHPELQVLYTRLLIRLMNKGVPIFTTTHSDFILQCVNNMIKLKDRQNMELVKEMGYSAEDCLNRQDVMVYQFGITEDGKTKVDRLSCGDYGFEVQTFYKTLAKLNDEIKKIEGEM